MTTGSQKKGFIDVLIGLQWGDEGKGKNIDELLSSGVYSGVARFHGGANAGHTLKYQGTTFIGHIIPSGCLHKNIDLYIGNGVVVDAVSLIKEINELKEKGFDITPRLFISNRAKLVSYLHPFLDQAEEAYRSKDGGNKIATTSRGIGPAYGDSRARRGLLIGDILYPDFDEKEKNLSKLHMDFLNVYKNEYGFDIPIEKINEARTLWLQAVDEIRKLQISDVSSLLLSKLSEGQNILAEGAQGVMLDIDFGDYPNVTSSNSLPANACLGLGVPHKYIRDIYGVLKAYTTKVGGGIFPSRIADAEIEAKFREAGNEFGATTGRPRMCGWLDLVALRHAISLSGTNKIFINKADICPVDKVKVVIGYEKDSKATESFPFRLNEIKVKTEDMSGWGNANYKVSDKSKVTKELSSYLEYISSKLSDLDVKIASVGTGPEREHCFVWEE